MPLGEFAGLRSESRTNDACWCTETQNLAIGYPRSQRSWLKVAKILSARSSVRASA